MEKTNQNAKQRYYLKNKDIYKERVRKQREEHKAKQINLSIQNNMPMQNSGKTRIDYILNFYSTIKTEYDFMMWVRNMRRVNKEVFNRETTQKESEIKEEPEIDAFTDCIRSFLKVGEKYVFFASFTDRLTRNTYIFSYKTN